MARTTVLLLAAAIGLTTACSQKKSAAVSASGGCDASIKLPDGFCATVFSDSAGPARELAVRKNGDVIAAVLDQRRVPGGVLVLRDTNHDGHADLEEQFGESGSHGVVLDGDSTLYVSTATAILRYHFADSLTPKKRVDTMVVARDATDTVAHTGHRFARQPRRRHRCGVQRLRGEGSAARARS